MTKRGENEDECTGNKLRSRKVTARPQENNAERQEVEFSRKKSPMNCEEVINKSQENNRTQKGTREEMQQQEKRNRTNFDN